MNHLLKHNAHPCQPFWRSGSRPYSPRYAYVGNVVNPCYAISSKEAWGWRRFEEEELNPKELYLINQ
jgi:hypothetical protein